MPTTNYYFNNYDYFGEQSLIESLITESIKIYGIQCYYMPRSFENSDTSVFGEDRLSRFDNAFAIEMYIKSVDGFEGEGDFLSKFGLEIRDEMTLTVSRRRFSEELYADDTTPVDEDEGSGRPSEGDLLYFPLNGKIFEVKFVEHEAIFYQMGSLQTYDIKLELFEYSNEILSTGIIEIDKIGIDYSTDILDNQIALEFYTTFASAESRLNANVTVDRGEVTNIVLLYGGENYALAPDVTIEPPTFTTGETAIAQVNLDVDTNLVANIQMTNVGRYYVNTPSISISNAEKISTSEYKFGNSSLYHSSNTDITFSTIELPSTITVGDQNRTYVSFWYKPTETPSTNSSILYSNNIMFFHRDDDKIVFRYSNTAVASSQGAVTVTLDGTSIDTATITDVGLGYDPSNPPRVIIANPDLPPQTATASANANLGDNLVAPFKLNQVELVTSGRYYQFSPSATITGDGVSALTVPGNPNGLANGSLILNDTDSNEDYDLYVSNANLVHGRVDFWMYIDPEEIRAGTILEANNGNDWSISYNSLRQFVLNTPDGSDFIYDEQLVTIPAWAYFSVQKPAGLIDGENKLTLIVDGATIPDPDTGEPVYSNTLQATVTTNTFLYTSDGSLKLKRTENTNYLIDVIRVNDNHDEEDFDVLFPLDSNVDTVVFKTFSKSQITPVATDGIITSLTIDHVGDCYSNNLVVTIDAPTGEESDFNARASIIVASNTSIDATAGVVVSNNGLGYSTVPTVFVDPPLGFELTSTDSVTANTWNHVYMETVGGFGVFTINNNIFGANGDVAIQELSSDIEFSEGRFKYGYSNTDLQVLRGFNGYIDNVIINETNDSFFVYDIRSLPTTETADLTDITGNTTNYVDNFDITTVTPTVNNGIVESISFTSGIGYENAPTITIGAPTGNAQSFRATAEAVRIQGVTTAVNVTYGGNFYTREPRVTFTGIETIGQILFEDGDTLQLEEFRVEDTVPSANNELFEEKSVEFIDFSEINPFSEGSKW